MRYYKVGVGFQGVALEYHIVGGRNMDEVRSYAIRNFLSPDKGYDHLEVKLIKREPAKRLRERSERDREQMSRVGG